MFLKRLVFAGLLAGFGLATSACQGGYGHSGVGFGYGVADEYGYAGPYFGHGLGYGATGFGSAGPSYFGWHDNFYYPGTGAFVYDRYRRPHRWSDGQRRYWQGRRGSGQIRDNWAGFRRDYRGDPRNNRQAYRGGTINRDGLRAGRREARGQLGREVRQDYRETGRDSRAVRNRTGSGPRAGGFRGGGSARYGGPRGSGSRRGRTPTP